MPRIIIGEFDGAAAIGNLLDSDPTLTYDLIKPSQVLDAVESSSPDLLLLDAKAHRRISRPISTLRNNNHIGYSMSLLLTAEQGNDLSALKSAFTADEVISRPFAPADLLLRIERSLRLKAIRQEIYLKDRFTMQSDLFKMLVHDMGNAIMMINSALTFYNQVPPGSPEAVQAVYDAYDSGSLLESMIRDSLDVLTIENRTINVRRVAADLGQLLDSLLKRFRPLTLDREVQLQYILQKDANTVVEVDPILIWRVVLNLLVNALKFSPAGSQITLSVTAGAVPNTIRITVKDEGPGIPPEIIPGLFEKDSALRLYRAHEARAGYGLGLLFCRLAVEAHEGSIFVESEIGKGSSFIVELPNPN